MKKFTAILFLTIAFLGAQKIQAQIQVLTGTEKGTYFQLANDMNKLLPTVEKVKRNDTVQVPFLDIRSTSGSSFNFEIITQKDHPAKVAIMQLDYLLLMKNDDMMKGTKKTADLAILMPLNVEDIHLVSKKGNKIHSLADLDGKIVAIGNKAEGTYSTATYIHNESKVEWTSKNISTQDVTRPLLLDKIDAFFVVATAPMDLLNINPVGSPIKYELASVEDINGWAEYFIPETIPAGTYSWQKNDVSTYGVPSVVVVNMSKISNEEKAQLLQWKATTIENLEKLKADGHPAWKTATVMTWDESIWPLVK